MSNTIKTISYKYDIVKSPLFMFGFCGDNRLCAAIMKLFQLEDRLHFANAYFRKAIQTDHNATQTSSKTGKTEHTEDAQRVMRFFYAESAILGYNACCDYILQIVFFALYICPEFHDNAEFKEMSKICSWNRDTDNILSIKKAFSRVTDKNPVARKFFDKLSTFYAQRETINHYANLIKHQGGFAIPEMKQPVSQCIYLDSNSEIDFDPSEMDSEYYELEKIIDDLYFINNKICKFTDELISFLNFPFDYTFDKYRPTINLSNAET